LKADLKDEFQQLWDSTDPEGRGLLFEDLFCRLLFKSGFVVHKDSASANPRQTDLLAEQGDDTFLFEIKWLRRRIDIAAVAQMNDRLRRTPKGTIGCICSASGFTEGLISDVEQHRSQFEILLFNPYEIHALFVQGISILRLIEEKRRGLRCDGTMWFLEQSPRSSMSQYVELPPSYESLQMSASSVHIPIQSSHFSDILFARTPLIFDEFLWAVSLSIRLDNLSVKELREVFTVAENCLGLRGKGTFGIRQRDSGWYGLGSDNFLKEITRYSQRYKGYKGHIHHSEELAFFDELNDGLFLLSARQSMTRKALIHSVEVIVRLRGIPVNTQPYLKFARSFTQYNVYFNPEPPLRRVHKTLPLSVKIEQPDVVTRIESRELNREKASISGVVLKNPFFNNPAKIAELSEDKELRAFSEPKYLFCTLDDWLDLGDEIDHYVLTALVIMAERA
jgi:Restriction endonuclease